MASSCIGWDEDKGVTGSAPVKGIAGLDLDDTSEVERAIPVEFAGVWCVALVLARFIG